MSGSHSLGKSTVVNDWVATHDRYIREDEPYRALGLFGPYEILFREMGADGMAATNAPLLVELEGPREQLLEQLQAAINQCGVRGGGN